MKRSRERQMEAEEAWAKRWEQLDAKAWRLFSFHESKFKEKRASHLRELYQEKYQGQINSQSYEYAIITRSWFMPKIITVKTDWIGHCCRNYARFCEDYSFLFDNISNSNWHLLNVNIDDELQFRILHFFRDSLWWSMKILFSILYFCHFQW